MKYQVVESKDKAKEKGKENENEIDAPLLMVFITGAGIGPFMWTHQVDYFEGYKKIIFNLPGHGDNSDVDFTTIDDVA
ncbi:MAG TPA: hypothetical protein VLS94_03100, partial [Fusibacter sp.]|nr:hypothetical protein [Fusibacter sp.]